MLIKNSDAKVMNNKDSYNRCIIPEICRGERGWIVTDTQEVRDRRKQQIALNRISKKEQIRLTKEGLKDSKMKECEKKERRKLTLRRSWKN